MKKNELTMEEKKEIYKKVVAGCFLELVTGPARIQNFVKQACLEVGKMREAGKELTFPNEI